METIRRPNVTCTDCGTGPKAASITTVKELPAAAKAGIQSIKNLSNKTVSGAMLASRTPIYYNRFSSLQAFVIPRVIPYFLRLARVPGSELFVQSANLYLLGDYASCVAATILIAMYIVLSVFNLALLNHLTPF